MNTYLLSSALSPTHHAVVQQIEHATSAPEVDAVCRRELDRLQHRLEKGKGRVQDADIVESLVLLLYLEQHRASPVSADALDFAFVHALNLAEGGRSRKTRAIGYLYLGLAHQPTNDLSLLHYNSIIKDLQSSHVGSIALALRAIVHAPSGDLAPAVQRQAVHLVSHKSPEIRRLALAALGALASKAPDALEGLRERKVWKRLKDSSASVSLQAVKVLVTMARTGLVDKLAATDALLELLHSMNTRTLQEGLWPESSLLKLELVRALAQPNAALDDGRRADVGAAIHDLLQMERSDPYKVQTLSLLLVSLRTVLRPQTWSTLLPTVLSIIKAALESASPNDVYFALRCLETLPLEESGETLADRDCMERLTSELQSEDEAIRKLAIRILGHLSPDLPAVHLDRVVLALSAAEKGQEKISFRALEVAIIIADQESAPRRGEVFANSVVRVARAAGHEVVLEGTVQQSLDWLHDASEEDQASFAATILTLASAAQSPSRTLSVVACAVLCEFGAKAHLTLRPVASALTPVLQQHAAPSLHQAALVSLAGVCATLDDDVQALSDVVAAVQNLRETASRYVRRRCDLFLRVASSADGFTGLRPYLSYLSLPTVLQAFEEYAKTLPDLSVSTALPSSPTLTLSARPTGASTLGLRYDAYPTAGKKSTRSSSSRRRSRSTERAPSRRLTDDKEIALATGQLALMAVYDSPSGAVETASPDVRPGQVPYKDDPDDPASSPFHSSPVKERRG